MPAVQSFNIMQTCAVLVVEDLMDKLAHLHAGSWLGETPPSIAILDLLQEA